MRLARDPDFRAIRRQHPNRNLQPPANRVDDGDRAIFPLRPAQDFNSSTLEWVKRIEDLDVRARRTQGIVGGGVTIPICIVSSQAVGCLWTASDGSPVGRDSSYRSACSPGCLGGCSWSS
jgi:hypothetical protein